jgi:putative transposase
VVDDCSHQCLAPIPISGIRVGRELNRLVADRGKPKMIVSGTEPSKCDPAMGGRSQVTWHCIATGKPGAEYFWRIARHS